MMQNTRPKSKKCPCEGCICVPICKNKRLNQVLNDCSIIRERIRSDYGEREVCQLHKMIDDFCNILNL